MKNSYGARTTLEVEATKYQIYALDALADSVDLQKLPYSIKILLENALRYEDGVDITDSHIDALAGWDPKAPPEVEIAFTPARVLMQDFTGVPAVVDLAAMRDAMQTLGGDPEKINPLSPADLVIDHSVMVDHFGTNKALDLNAAAEYRRNKERYAFLRWGQSAFANFQVVPPATGIVHQVNLEYLARVVFSAVNDGVLEAYPDTLVGTDSHTTMINGLGVLGWGVGGIEAEAAMLGQAISMLIPQVVGFKLYGRLPEGATATDLVLTVVQMLRAEGVVGKFVEFFGEGLDHLSLADQATIANMAPEYGATCGIFPIDTETLNYLRLTGRADEQVALVEAYAKRQGLFREPGAADAEYSKVLELDLASVEPSLAGPKRPQDRIPLRSAREKIQKEIEQMGADRTREHEVQEIQHDGQRFELDDGHVVIAAITSCTNTSNPDVIIGAGLVAKKAVELGIGVKPWVKTSLAPGSQVVGEYLQRSGLMTYLERLGFDVVGYGCTTCIGNSGPLPEPISEGIANADLIACSILSGNRNFEGRVHQEVRMNFLASPPLVVAYALAGSMTIDIYNDPIAQNAEGTDVFLKDLWPSQHEIRDLVSRVVSRELFLEKYADVFTGDSRWAGIETSGSASFRWEEDSTYIQQPPYFIGMGHQPDGISEIKGCRVLAFLGDSITTDHISPAGAIKADTPAGQYLIERGVKQVEFNSYGSRRGNHEVMMRGTFANIRLRNELAPGTEGGWTRHLPSGEQMTIYDAAMRYKQEGTSLFVIGGKEYGTGSSRDWAAKGSRLLGVVAVLVESFERIHRSNLIGMGVLPLQFEAGTTRHTLGLTGTERYDVEGLETGIKSVTIVATGDDDTQTRFEALVRIDTPKEWDYFVHGGILHYVLRQLAHDSQRAA
ncbi:MAG: aconitate hydratase AcnA [Gammaproteobacteria bacterium]|nr:aconitate hydratase AcnA [Gammaproteobacteria bacterium]MDH3465510.1 aconitate hydratase AcnA [Gammaproteobacteria bacterium]